MRRRTDSAPVPTPDLVELVTSLINDTLSKRRLPPLVAGMSRKECAMSSGVGLSTIDEAIASGELEAMKIRKRTIITPAAQAKWLDARERIKPREQKSMEVRESA